MKVSENNYRYENDCYFHNFCFLMRKTSVVQLLVTNWPSESNSNFIEIALHGHEHISFERLSLEEAIEDLQIAKGLLYKNKIKFNSKRFALPYGDIPKNFNIKELIKEMNLDEVYGTFPWTKNSILPRLLYWHE